LITELLARIASPVRFARVLLPRNDKLHG